MLSRRTFLQSALLLPAAFTSASSARAQEAAPGTIPAQAKPSTEVFADFEGGTYDGWTIEGDAFGTAPATDALFPNQIAGYTGRGFLCSLHPRKGNAATGKATSREFTVEKPFIRFKIGGGNHPNEACMNLVVDGQIVRTATGSDTPVLSDASWDVSELVGKKAHLEVVDSTASPDRGYILVDDIHFTDGIDPQQQSHLEALVASLKHDYPLPGIWAATGYQGRVVGAACAGFAKLEDGGKPATLQQRIAYGSTTKALTGVLASIYIYKGLLGYSTRVSDIVPKLVEGYDRETQGMTVEQLITHRSGLGGGPDWESINETDPSAARYHQAKSILKLPRNGTPGTETGYAGGTVIIGVMLEKITGKPLEVLFKQELFDRFGMASCMLGDPCFYETNPDIAWGYNFKDGKYKRAGGPRPRFPIWYQASAAGGAYGSVTDLAKYYSRLSEGRKLAEYGLSTGFYEKVLSFPQGAFTTYGGYQSAAFNVLSHGGGTDRGQIIGFINLATRKTLVVAFNSCDGAQYFSSITAQCLKWIQSA